MSGSSKRGLCRARVIKTQRKPAMEKPANGNKHGKSRL
jgi:hypothetical protein